MSSVIQDLYLQAHGATVLMRDWSEQHRANRPEWPLADYLATCREMFAKAFHQFDSFCRTGAFDDPSVRFCDFAQTLRELLAMSDVALRVVGDDRAHSVAAASLLASMTRASEILAEDSFATDMAMLSLDEQE